MEHSINFQKRCQEKRECLFDSAGATLSTRVQKLCNKEFIETRRSGHARTAACWLSGAALLGPRLAATRRVVPTAAATHFKQ
jgi:hypothetical protein